MPIDYSGLLNSSDKLAGAWQSGLDEGQARREKAIAARREEEARQATAAYRARLSEIIQRGDYNSAAATAAAFGDDKAATNFREMAKTGYERADASTKALGNIANAVLAQPYEQRKATLQALKPRLTAMGINGGEIDVFDPTDDNLRAIAGVEYTQQARVENENKAFANETDRITATNPVVVGGSLVTRTGDELYRAPEFKAVGLDQNLYEIGGTNSTGFETSLTGNAAAMAKSLSGLGFSPAMVAGVLANVQHESSFNPAGSGDGGSAHGYFQHRGARATNFERVMGVHPSKASPEQAAQFFKWELEHPEQAGIKPEGLAAIKNARTAEEAAMAIQEYYERPAKVDPKRAATAAGYFRSFTSNGTGKTTTSRDVRKIQEGQPKPTAGGKGSKEAPQSASSGASNARATIARLKNHKGLSAAVGSAFDPASWGSINPLTGQPFAGTKAAGFKAEFDTLKAQVFLPAVQALRGMGQLSNAEGQKLENSLQALSTDMSEKDFRAMLDRLDGDFKRIETIAEMERRAGNDGLPVAMNAAQARYLPAGTRFRTPDGRVMRR